MLDAALRPLIDPPLDRIGQALAAQGVSANAVTVAGFAIGLAALPALAAGLYAAALLLILVNRLLDGVDGAVALADPANALAASFLVFSFMGTGASFLAYAAVAAKRRVSVAPSKTFFYLGGLTEGTETILCFVLMCLFPAAFATIAWIFGALCWITTATRVVAAYQAFSE
jgi:phosphatidylglycerophosphate synthase